MDDHPQSSGERHIERLMAELDPASARYQVLETARRFKATWVELGERLVEVSSRGLFREWGYESFTEYCSRELRIKRPTAEKLTLAYRFLERREPTLLARQHDPAPFPDFRSVDLLRQASEERDFSADEYAALRASVVDEERSLPTVRKHFREVMRGRQPARPVDPLVSLRDSLAAARRLAQALAEVPELPAAYREQVDSLVVYLEGEARSLKVL